MKLSDRVKAYAKMQSEASDYFSYAWWDKPKNVPIAELLRLAEEVEKNVKLAKGFAIVIGNSTSLDQLRVITYMNRARQAKARLIRLAVRHGVAEEMGIL